MNAFDDEWDNVTSVAITGVIFAGIHCVGNISGAAFNPAVALALAFANGGDFTYALFVSVANFIGAIVATVVFYLTAPEEVNALPWQWVKRLEQAATQRRRHESEPLIASVSSSKR